MLVRWVSAALAMVLMGPPVFAQDNPPIMARAELCLRSNVDRVVAVDPSLDSAANFLITYVCAAEISSVLRYEQNLAFVHNIWSLTGGVTKDGGAGKAQSPPPTPPRVDPDTGDIIAPKHSEDASASPQAQLADPIILGRMASSTHSYDQLAAPVSLRRLAGFLVLEARERQLAKAR